MRMCRNGLHSLEDPDNLAPTNRGVRCLVCLEKRKHEHYDRTHPEKGKPRGIDSDVCGAEGCDRPRLGAKGGRSRYCGAHRWRMWKYGDLYLDVPPGTGSRSLPLRRAELAQPSSS